MKVRIFVFVSVLAAAALALTACGGAAPATEAPFGDQAFRAENGVVEAPAADFAAQGEPEQLPAPMPTAQAIVDVGAPPESAPSSAGRLIIKNADIRLLVADTDVAIDRATQIVGDLGGYIVSSRVWYEAYYEHNLKFATITIGVPVDRFERALTRMRELSVRVLDESASGEDVTDQYVDLQSQLTNLEATRERIKSFLDQAENVDEALRINQQLSEIERQIEQIKGQINYLSDRSAYSTVTISLEPERPEIVTPTPEPLIWDPGETFDDAKKTLTLAYQGILDFLIWFLVALLPILAPPALIVWLVWKLLTRKPTPPAGK